MSQRRLQRIKDVSSARQEGIVVLEDIYDPHNAAAVLRTCEAFGFQKVWFIFEKQKKFDPKKTGKVSSSSANKWLSFEVFDSTKKCFAKLKRLGYQTFSTVLDSKAKSLYKTNFKNPKIALCFGNEHRGLSQTAIEAADTHVYIPMQGFVQSLNLSVTAAICLYEVSRQRQTAKGKFLLGKTEQNKLIQIWKKK